MTERPILFSGPMVRAIHEGKKTQTRRVVKIQPRSNGDIGYYGQGMPFIRHPNPCRPNINCPYGNPGDRLWVRETWRPEELDAQGHDEIGDPLGDYPDGTDGIQYQADDAFIPIENSAEASDKWHSLLRRHETWPELRPTVWRPSIHMPRWASRITLEVTGVRVEKLQEISQADAIAEGGPPSHWTIDQVSRQFGYEDFPRSWFAQLWDDINAKRGHGWATNPWVWVVEFKRVIP